MDSFTNPLVLLLASTPLVAAAQNNTVSIPSSYTYNLAGDFKGNVSQNFIDTSDSNATVGALLASAKSKPFISYSEEFSNIIGPSPELTLVQQRNGTTFAYEAGVWDPIRDEVYFTSSIVQPPSSLQILNLSNLTIRSANTSLPLVNPNGGYYFAGKVYITCLGNATNPGGIFAIDPVTGHTETVVNSYFGLRYNGIDDVTWAHNNKTNESCMYFTDLIVQITGILTDNPPPVLPTAVWRYSPHDESITPVISRADINLPNGIRVTPDQRRLIVSDSTPISLFGPESNSSGSPAIYEFDLDEKAFPVNKRMLGLARKGIPDGMKIDDKGRIWTAEGEGIVVRSQKGQVLGVLNQEYFESEGQTIAIANFALAGNRIIVEAVDRLWLVKVQETLTTRQGFFP